MLFVALLQILVKAINKIPIIRDGKLKLTKRNLFFEYIQASIKSKHAIIIQNNNLG